MTDQVPIHDDEPEIQYDLPTGFSVFGNMPALAIPQEPKTPLSGSAVHNLQEEEGDFYSFEESDDCTTTPQDSRGARTPASTSRGTPASSQLADTQPATPATPGGEEGELAGLPPWITPAAWTRTLAIRSPLLRLHQEIVDFMRYVQPSAEEETSREAAVVRVRETVMSIWPEAKLEVFGSYACGLYLPTSDIDAVLLGSGCRDPVKGLRALANALNRRDMATDVQVIAKAKVPIVKFVEKASGFQFDISFDVANGPAAADWVVKQMRSLVALKPIALVLKIFLQQRELNEVYTGGIGSYALLTMIIGHLFMHPSRFTNASQTLDDNLGLLLLEFLELYGRKMNHEEVGISVQDGGSFYSKKERKMFQENRPFLFSVEDPGDKSNDIARNSYGAQKVRVAFDYAYQSIVAAEEPDDQGGSLLERLVRLDPVLQNRQCPTPPRILSMPGEEEQAHALTPGSPKKSTSKRERNLEKKRQRKKARVERKKQQAGAGKRYEGDLSEDDSDEDEDREEIRSSNEHLSQKPRNASRHDTLQDESCRRNRSHGAHEVPSHSSHARSHSESSSRRAGGSPSGRNRGASSGRRVTNHYSGNVPSRQKYCQYGGAQATGMGNFRVHSTGGALPVAAMMMQQQQQQHQQGMRGGGTGMGNMQINVGSHGQRHIKFH